MRLGKVIGRVTFSQSISAFEGGRWLIVNPYTRDQYCPDLSTYYLY